MKVKKPPHLKTEVSIKGWDWTEISKILEISEISDRTKGYYGEGVVLKKTKKKLGNIYRDLVGFNVNNKNSKLKKEELELKIKQIRYFVYKLSEQKSGYTSPLYRGLYEIGEDSEFIKFVNILLPYLWS